VGFFVGGIPKQNLEEEVPPFKPPKSINFGGRSSGGWLFIRFLGLETTQQIYSPGGRVFLQSNTHHQFSIKILFMIWWLSKERSVFNKNSTLKEKSKMIKDRFVTKTLHNKTKKITKKSPSAPSRKKERKNERNLPSIFFKSQDDTFQCLMAPHSFVTGAHGGEAQRADAAARHQGRSKPWKKIRVQYRGFIGIFSIPGVYRVFSQYRGFIRVVTKNTGVDLRWTPSVMVFWPINPRYWENLDR